MSIESGIGVSTQEDLVQAAQEAAAVAREQCPAPAIVLVFVNHNYPEGLLKDACKAIAGLFPEGTQIAGGTVNGITYEESRYDAVYANARAVAVLALGGPDLKVAAALAAFGDDPVKTGQTLTETVQEKLGEAAEGGLIFTPGFSAGFSIDQKILNGVRMAAPRLRLSGTGFSGGMDVDGKLQPGIAFLGDRQERMGTLLVAFGGKARCGFSMGNGMKALGPGGFVTEAEGSFVVSINHKPAKEAVLDLLGQAKPDAKEHFEKNLTVACVENGVALAIPDPEGDFFWASGLAFFTPDGKAADVSQQIRKGTALSLVSINPESCMGAIKQAGEMLEEDAGTSNFDCVLAFSCMLRGFTLGPDVAHEDVELRRYVKSKNHLGIVANGEIGSYRHGRPFATSWVYALFGLTGEWR